MGIGPIHFLAKGPSHRHIFKLLQIDFDESPLISKARPLDASTLCTPLHFLWKLWALFSTHLAHISKLHNEIY